MAATGSERQTIEVSPSTKAVGFWSAVLSRCLAYLRCRAARRMARATWIGRRANKHKYATGPGRTFDTFTILGLIVSRIGREHSPNSTCEPQGLELGRCGFCHDLCSFDWHGLLCPTHVCRPRLARGEIEGMEVFLFVPFDSFLYSVDILGYSFMSVATLLAGRVFQGRGLRRIVRWLLTANGMLLPFIALQIYFHPLIWCASLWAVTFPGADLGSRHLFSPHGDRIQRNCRPEAIVVAGKRTVACRCKHRNSKELAGKK